MNVIEKKPSKAEQARARAARQRRRRTLGVEAIVDQALRIVDDEGVGEVTMRRVAAAFDTGPASLYAHVANKDELLGLVLDRVLGEVPMPSGDTWQDIVRSWAHQTRQVFQRHNDIAQLTFAHIPVNMKVAETAEVVLGSMVEAGVPAQVAGWALDIMALYVGADAYEGYLLGQRFRDGSGRDPEEVGMEELSRAQNFFAGLPADRFPHLLANLGALMSGDSDERFSFGIDMLIAGFAAQAKR